MNIIWKDYFSEKAKCFQIISNGLVFGGFQFLCFIFLSPFFSYEYFCYNFILKFISGGVILLKLQDSKKNYHISFISPFMICSLY